MPKTCGHAFPEGGVCDNYGISGNYRTAIYLSIKLSTQVLKYQSTQGLSLSISIKLRLTYESLQIDAMKI